VCAVIPAQFNAACGHHLRQLGSNVIALVDEAEKYSSRTDVLKGFGWLVVGLRAHRRCASPNYRALKGPPTSSV
jgi:hypothetical protein